MRIWSGWDHNTIFEGTENFTVHLKTCLELQKKILKAESYHPSNPFSFILKDMSTTKILIYEWSPKYPSTDE